MATGDYCTLAELKARLWPDDTTPDTVNDNQLTNVITGVSKEINIYCGRRFYSTTADETRYYSAQAEDILFPDDIQSITTLKVDYDGDRTYETTLDTGDYELFPLNASLDSEPYTWIEITPAGSEVFPTHKKGVQIVGKFGYCTTDHHPEDIREACLLSCLRLFKRKDAPFGVLGPTELGQVSVIPGLDPDVKRTLDHYRRLI